MSNPAVSEQVVTPVVESPTAPAPAEKAAKMSAKDLAAKINGELLARPSTPENQPSTETADAAVEAIEAAGGEAPDKAPGESEKSYAHRVAAIALKLQESESKGLKYKGDAEKFSARVKELEARLEAAAKDPHELLKLGNLTFEQLAERAIAGEFRSPEIAPKTELPADVKEMLAEHKAMKEKAAKDAEQAQLAEVHTANLKAVSDALSAQDFIEKFPLVAAMPNASERMLNYIQAEMQATGEEPDFATIAEQANKAVLSEASALLQNESVLKTLLSNEGLRAVVSKALGLTPAESPKPTPGKQSEKGNPTKTLTNSVAGKVPSRTAKAGNDADLAARINQMLSGQ